MIPRRDITIVAHGHDPTVTSWFLVFQVESLRKDIEILSQNHERDVDRKDAIIQMLDRDLEEVRGLIYTLP